MLPAAGAGNSVSSWDRWFGNLLNKTADSPQTSICILFFLYKSLFLVIALASPGYGYDASTILSGWPDNGPLAKLVRWDALWFANVAQRGYKWEQDWAWGYGYTTLLSFGQNFWHDDSFDTSVQREALFGIVISHVSHLCGALLLYRISLMVFRNHDKGERIAFLASCLHVLSPAGMFLCAPYTEAPFSVLKFAAYFAYASASLDQMNGKTMLRDVQLLISGALIGMACMFRSNGLLSGTIFLLDAVEDGLAFLRYRGNFARLRKIIVTVAAGLMVAVGQAYPQFLAYLEFCTDRNPFEKRPWCNKIPPSIYTYVQEHYWWVGPFRYWHAGNIPMFFLAAPTLYIMFRSSWWVWTIFRNPPMTAPAPAPEGAQLLAATSPNSAERSSVELAKSLPVEAMDTRLLVRFAIPQLFIALTCLFVVHVQIITRLSSGYPVWYWWLAYEIIKCSTESEGTEKKSKLPMFLTRWAVMYGVIQGGLFASFLPPA